jgi:hypothetical protein
MISENHLQPFACRYMSEVLPTIVSNPADIYRQFYRQLSASKSTTTTYKKSPYNDYYIRASPQ